MKKEYSIGRMLLSFVFITVLGWVVFTFADWMYENGIINFELTSLLWFVISIVFGILYCVKRKKYLNTIQNPIGSYFIMFGSWIVINLIFGFPICSLVNNNQWIIPQPGHYFFDFNGIEYFVYAVFVSIIPIVISALAELTLLIVRQCKKKR